MLWLAGTLYAPDKDGTIAVPFSNAPGRQPLVLSDGQFSSLAYFEQESENYQLAAAMYVDREQLIARRTAKLLVRPQLSLDGTPVSRKVLEDVRLVITSTDLDNVTSTKEVPDFKLFDDRESTYEFLVPQRLSSIRFQLKAKVQNQSRNQKLDLAVEQVFALNEIDKTDKIEDLHFAQVGADYVVDLLGKTGEPKRDRPVQFVLKLRDYTQPVYVSLQSNAQGRVVLGPLVGVVNVTATSPQGVSHTWPIRHDEHTYPQTMNADVGDSVEVPYMGDKAKPDRAEVSLLELRGERFFADRFENLSIKDGFLQIDKLPPGNYSLLLKDSGREIALRLTAGVRRDGYVLGDYRKLEVRNDRPLQIKAVVVKADTIQVQLENATPFTRVHVLATRFEPAYAAYPILASILPPEPYHLTIPEPESQYVAGRNIGDEYRYIIDRKFARKYPGNMLERPSLLLNPWAIRSTETGQQEAQGGEEFSRLAAQNQAAGGRAERGSRRPLRSRAISPISTSWPPVPWSKPISRPTKRA